MWGSLSLFYRWGKWGIVKLKTLAKDYRTSKWNKLLIPSSSQTSVFDLWLSNQAMSWQMVTLLGFCSRWPVFRLDAFPLWQTFHAEAKPHPALIQMGLAMRHIETSEFGEQVKEERAWPGPKVSCCIIQRPTQIIQNWHSQDLAWVVWGGEAEAEGLEKEGPHIPQMKLEK